MTSAGVMSLDGYSGKSIRVAFHYAGNKKEGTTTTYQVDNIVIGNDIPTPVNTELRFALYEKESKGCINSPTRAKLLPFRMENTQSWAKPPMTCRSAPA